MTDPELTPAERVTLQALGRRVNRLRVAARLTLDELGSAAAFSRDTIRRIEAGCYRTRPSTIRAIVAAAVAVEPSIAGDAGWEALADRLLPPETVACLA